VTPVICEGLAELFRERLRHDARKDVDRSARRKADDHAHRAVRVGLCGRMARAREQWRARERQQ
jgi:hypothetical protein